MTLAEEKKGSLILSLSFCLNVLSLFMFIALEIKTKEGVYLLK